MAKKIWVSKHQKQCIDTWRGKRIIYKSNSVEDWKELYNIYMNTLSCPCCSVEFVDGSVGSNRRCLDHDHNTGKYRNTICHICNTKTDREPNVDNTSGWRNISLIKHKYKGKIVTVSWDYKRHGFKSKSGQFLSKLLVRSFFNEVKHLVNMKTKQ